MKIHGGQISWQKVKLYPLNLIPSEKGNIRHVIDKYSEGFDIFSEAYISEINPGSIKGWTLHKNKISNLIVVKGHVKFVFVDSLEPDKFFTYELAKEIPYIIYTVIFFPLILFSKSKKLIKLSLICFILFIAIIALLRMDKSFEYILSAR